MTFKGGISRVLLVIVCIAIAYTIGRLVNNKSDDTQFEIKLEQPEFFLEEPKEGLMDCLKYYGVEHPEIVYAQAVLETGHFRSKNCKERCNLFGLVDARTGKYYRFKHWSESVIAYRDYVQYKWKPKENYYKFLQRIGYAEDSSYISKVKQVQKKYGVN